MCLMYGTQMSSCVMSDSIPKTMRVVVNLYKEVQLAMHAYAQVKMGCVLPPCTLDNCNFLCDEPLWIAVKSLRLGLRRWRGKMRIWAPRISDHYLWLFHSLWTKFSVSFHPKLSTNASRKPRCDSVQAVANPRAVLVDDLPEEEASDGALGGSPYMCRGHASLSTNPCDELICTVYVYIYIHVYIYM